MVNTKGNQTSFFSTRNRWILTLVATILIYFYLFLGASQGNKKGASEENKATALWLNPAAHGYNKVIGNPHTPHLWNPKDPKEWILIGVILMFLPINYFFFRKREPQDPHWLTMIKSFVVWANFAVLILLIPINPFHRRFLYNFKVVLAQILKEPAKELFLAFVFIVLVPLPGGENPSVSDRYLWLAIKMGIFYIFQSLILGSPTYKISPPNQEKVIYMTKKQARYYALIIIGTITAVVIEKYAFQKL